MTSIFFITVLLYVSNWGIVWLVLSQGLSWNYSQEKVLASFGLLAFTWPSLLWAAGWCWLVTAGLCSFLRGSFHKDGWVASQHIPGFCSVSDQEKSRRNPQYSLWLIILRAMLSQTCCLVANSGNQGSVGEESARRFENQVRAVEGHCRSWPLHWWFCCMLIFVYVIASIIRFILKSCFSSCYLLHHRHVVAIWRVFDDRTNKQ